VRNAAKHMGAQTDTEIVADLEDVALWMLVRACDNHKRLDLDATVRMAEFDNWLNKNVVGTKIDV
jgi:hypothetical protein